MKKLLLSKLDNFRLIFIWAALVLAGCGPIYAPPAPTPTIVPTPLPALQFEQVAFGTQLITAFAFLPDGRLLMAEQDGLIRQVGTNGEHPIIHQFGVSRAGYEDGLLGLTLDPDFESNSTLYTYRTVPDVDGNPQVGEVAKHVFVENQLEFRDVILELPLYPDQRYHFGGGLTFGPDGYLYMIFGDANRPDLARDLSTPISSVLRFASDGSVPADNPFPDSIVYAWGVRNGFGLAWHPETGYLYAGENGDSCDDELNLIEPGQDYGWGLHEYNLCPYPDDATQPLLQWTPAIAPSALTFFTADSIPEFSNKLLLCGINQNQIHQISFSIDGRSVARDEILEVSGRDFFCQGALAQGPDGWLYTAVDGEIFRIGR
ncbi:MAG: sorbosone dehydrogenase family protein [Anaerolineae bacterium]